MGQPVVHFEALGKDRCFTAEVGIFNDPEGPTIGLVRMTGQG